MRPVAFFRFDIFSSALLHFFLNKHTYMQSFIYTNCGRFLVLQNNTFREESGGKDLSRCKAQCVLGQAKKIRDDF